MTSLLMSLKLSLLLTSVNANEHELDVFPLMQQDGMLLLNLTVKERILDSVCFDDLHLVWRHLRTTFYRDSYNFAVQQFKVHSLHARVDVRKPLTEHIEPSTGTCCLLRASTFQEYLIE